MGNPIEMRDTKPVEPGADVRLTLDANLQDRAEEVLNEVGEKWQPKGATAIVMDPHSGAILALANWPRVNANALDEAPDYARRTARSAPPTSPARRSRRSPSPPRSRTARSRPSTKFNLPPVLPVADREINDAEAHG